MSIRIISEMILNCIISLFISTLTVNSWITKYNNYRLYRIHIDTNDQLEIIKELKAANFGIQFYGHPKELDQILSLVVPEGKLSDVDDLFQRYNISNTVLIPNIQHNMDQQWSTVQPKSTPGDKHDFQHYSQLDTIYDYLQYVSNSYSFVSPLTIGTSFEGRPIKGIKISQKANNPGIFIEGGIHAREWISPATTTYIINQLLTSTNSEIKNLVSSYDWYIFPVVNPDGYVYTFENDRLWRKNRKPYGLCVGVDLNRNFDNNWNGTGSSSNPCCNDFCGSSANSEPEVQAIVNFLRQHHKQYRIKTYLSLHSLSQLIMFPYGHTSDKVANYNVLKAIADKGAQAIKNRHGKIYKTGSVYEAMYQITGTSLDWVTQELGIKIGYSVELRGNQDSLDLFMLPAQEIIPVGEEIMDFCVAFINEAHRLGYFY